MMNSQSELTIERPGSFIGLPMVEIRGAYLELNQSQTRSRVAPAFTPQSI